MVSKTEFMQICRMWHSSFLKSEDKYHSREEMILYSVITFILEGKEKLLTRLQDPQHLQLLIFLDGWEEGNDFQNISSLEEQDEDVAFWGMNFFTSYFPGLFYVESAYFFYHLRWIYFLGIRLRCEYKDHETLEKAFLNGELYNLSYNCYSDEELKEGVEIKEGNYSKRGSMYLTHAHLLRLWVKNGKVFKDVIDKKIYYAIFFNSHYLNIFLKGILAGSKAIIDESGTATSIDEEKLQGSFHQYIEDAYQSKAVIRHPNICRYLFRRGMELRITKDKRLLPIQNEYKKLIDGLFHNISYRDLSFFNS